MNVAEELKTLLADRPSVNWAIYGIEATEWGCRYVWDGLMNCHIVFDRGQYVDVQDVIDGWKPWEDTGHADARWTRYDSVLSLVLAIQDMIEQQENTR